MLYIGAGTTNRTQDLLITSLCNSSYISIAYTTTHSAFHRGLVMHAQADSTQHFVATPDQITNAIDQCTLEINQEELVNVAHNRGIAIGC